MVVKTAYYVKPYFQNNIRFSVDNFQNIENYNIIYNLKRNLRFLFAEVNINEDIENTSRRTSFI